MEKEGEVSYFTMVLHNMLQPFTGVITFVMIFTNKVISLIFLHHIDYRKNWLLEVFQTNVMKRGANSGC